jgi:hypothetical protein
MTLRPLTANAFAESPSVRMSVHCDAFDVPAKLASESFGMFNVLADFLGFVVVVASICS